MGWEFSRGNTRQHGRNFWGVGTDVPPLFFSHLIVDFLATVLNRGKIENKYLLNDYLGGVKTRKDEKPAYHETQN